MTPRGPWRVALVVGAVVLTLAAGYFAFRYPADTTPQGAYMRIAAGIGEGKPQRCFAYLEEEAQVATYTIHSYAKKAAKLIRAAYPEPHKSRALVRYAALADQPDPPAVWARMASDRGWVDQLRRDLSGVAQVEIVGERASIVTARGTRYPFRRRPNRIWGLTIFTAHLDAHARKLARDWALIQRAAADYEQGE